LPLLSRIPIIGALFGQQKLRNNRTELVLFITPRVVESELDMRGVMNELRRRMENMDALVPIIRPLLGPIFPDSAPVAPGMAPFTSPPVFPPVPLAAPAQPPGQ
jgi:general secretion pathway protein D